MPNNSGSTNPGSSNNLAQWAFWGSLCVAIIGVAGVIYNANVARETAWIPVWATLTAEAKLTLNVPTNTAAPTMIATSSATSVLPAPTRSATPSPQTTIPQTSTATPTPTRLPSDNSTAVIWKEDVVGVPPSGNEITRQLGAGEVLMFGGQQFSIGNEQCRANPETEICILLYQANKSQNIVITNVIERQNRIGIALTQNPEDALNDNERLLWLPPNCVNGCQKARVYVFIDGELARTFTRTGAQSQPTPTPDCSLTKEFGPWPTPRDVTINQDRDGWFLADFWSPSRKLKEDYDEVTVIFEPGLRVTVSGVAGIAWKYERTWLKQDVEWCTAKHIREVGEIRHEKLILIPVAELCSIVPCR